ncbi:hypothetical protein D3C78_1974870 [compost metagenome]
MQLPDASVLAPLGLVMRKTEPRSAIAEKCFAEARKLFGCGVALEYGACLKSKSPSP